MAESKSVHRLGLEAEAEKNRLARREARGTRKYRASEKAKAEEFIEQAVETATAEPKAPRAPRKPKSYNFTAEELREAREGGSGRSWADVAKLLGLPNPGAARKAWAELTGQPHTSAKALQGRARKGAGSSNRLAAPKWDDTADRQTIVDTLVGAKVIIKAGLYGGDSVETIHVAKVYRFDDTLPDRPAVEILEGVYGIDPKTKEKVLLDKASTGARRTVFLDRIVEVR